MGAGETPNFWALTLLILPGVVGGQWAVWYPETTVCAVRGSTVVIKCAYDYPERNGQVNQTMWCLNHMDCIDTEYVCHSENINIASQFKDRAQCLGDKQKNCTLKVKNITDTDAGEYRFRFITDKDRLTGQDGVTLTITELSVLMTSSSKNGTIREGDSVNLTCATKGCSLSQSEFIWVKDKERLQETHSTLHFNHVLCRNKGKYSCTFKGGGVRSEEFQLDIQGSSCPDPETSNSSLISITVGTLLASLAIVLVLLVYFKRRKTGVKEGKECEIQGCDTYASLDVQSTSPDYDTLVGMKR